MGGQSPPALDLISVLQDQNIALHDAAFSYKLRWMGLSGWIDGNFLDANGILSQVI